MCVECLFFKCPGVKPLTGPISVRQKGGCAPPHVIPHPESLVAQEAYTEALRC